MHDIWFAHPYSRIDYPICRTCGAVITLERWLDGEECPVLKLWEVPVGEPTR